jgi:hypothetical protein
VKICPKCRKKKEKKGGGVGGEYSIPIFPFKKNKIRKK